MFVLIFFSSTFSRTLSSHNSFELKGTHFLNFLHKTDILFTVTVKLQYFFISLSCFTGF